MRCLLAIVLLCVAAPVYGRITKELAAPPEGATLPVILNRTLKPHTLKAGDPVTVQLVQTVPVSAQVSLPAGTKLDGHVVSVNDASISLLFDQLRWKGRTLPIHVRLVAAAAPFNVYQTRLPLGATDRSTSNPGDWTTRQIGGDEVYLSGGAGKVYNQYSEPVGYADRVGVYADPAAPGALPRAIGPFSTTARGLHGFPALSIVSEGSMNAPITLAANKLKWQIGYGSAFLLEVVH